MTLFLDLRASDAGGIPAAEVTPREAFTPIPIAQMAKIVTGRDVLIGTHGFNAHRADGIAELSNWEKLLSLGPNGLFIGLLWPGDARWTPIIDYPVEGEVAINSGKLLASFLNQNFLGANSLSFVSHSLGARTVLETIRGLTFRVSNLVLMAGAIEDDCLTDEYRDTAQKIGAISVLASTRDEVLALAFPIGNLVEGILTPTHPFFHSAIGHLGPRPPYLASLNKNWQIPEFWDYGHLNYLPSVTSAATPVTTPVNLPVPARTPSPSIDQKPAWSAAFVSARVAK
jgi:Alpha/beta hydrolase of unknown function (DUF900)